MTYRRSVRRLASAVAAANSSSTSRFRIGVTALVTPGGSLDGKTAVWVRIGGDTIPAAYLESYIPTLNDVVLVLINVGSPLILGQVIGFPNV